jgi:hypothetical protein
VDRCFVEDAFAIIDFVAAINQVLNVFLVRLARRLVQILDHIASKLVFAHVQGAMRFSESS